jgi:aminopeptidase-like protein
MSILLISHIIIALSGILITTILLLKPSSRKLNASYIFLAGTLTTGTILVLSTPGHMLQSCVTGILYTAFVVGGIAIAKRRMTAREHTNS